MTKIRLFQSQPPPWPEFAVPDDWVKQGQPDGRGMVTCESQDGKVCMGVWQAQPSTFKWDYEDDEFIYLLKGKVEISTEDGQSVTLTAGCQCHIPAGTKAVWEIIEPLEKVFFVKKA